LRIEVARRPRQTVPVLRELRREVSRRLRAIPGGTLLTAAQALIAKSDACPRWFAFELVHHHPAAMAALTAGWLNRLAKGLGAWHEVDPYGLYLLGPAWREDRIDDAWVAAWTTSGADRGAGSARGDEQTRTRTEERSTNPVGNRVCVAALRGARSATNSRLRAQERASLSEPFTLRSNVPHGDDAK
jgi:hypothetical protein